MKKVEKCVVVVFEAFSFSFVGCWCCFVCLVSQGVVSTRVKQLVLILWAINNKNDDDDSKSGDQKAFCAFARRQVKIFLLPSKKWAGGALA